MDILNLYVGMKIRVATFDANNSVTDSTQFIAASIYKFVDSVVKSFSTARHSRVDMSGETIGFFISLRLDFDIL